MSDKHQALAKMLAAASLLIDDMTIDREDTHHLDQAFSHIDSALTHVLKDVAIPAKYDFEPLQQVMGAWGNNA